MLLLLTLLLSCVAVCAQPVLSLNDPTVVAKSSSLLQGLVGYWQLEESSGTRYDRSPYGNHLTAVNSPGSAGGIVGTCAGFSAASSQDLEIAATDSLMSACNDYTVTAWVKLKTKTNLQVFVSLSETSNDYVVMFYNPSSDRFVTQRKVSTVLYPNSSGVKADNFGSPTTNVWNFVAVSYAKTTKTLSIGVNAGTKSSAVLSAANPTVTTNVYWSLGKYIASLPYFSDAYIDEVGYWNRVLSGGEISTLYRSGLGVTYPRFSMRDNRADDFNWDTWEPLYDKPKPFPTLIAFVNRREPEPLLTICE